MTLSNKLSFFRLLLAPVYFILFWIDKHQNHPEVTLIVSCILIVLVILGEISDALDGSLARSRQEITDFGKLFDPFADYVTRFTFFFCFWWLELCPAWMVVVIFYREAIVSFLRLLVRGENVVLAARKTGKFKAIIQAIAIFVILGARLISFWIPNFPVVNIATGVMAVVVIITVISMVDYIYSCRAIIAQIPK